MSNVDWFLWRPILRGVATLEEIETHWSINDLFDANEALDIQDEVDDWARRQATQGR